MKSQLPYHSSSDAIKGCDKSNLAKYEKNDCVVRAIASAFDISYEDSHEYVRNRFRRQNRKGTMYFVYTMNSLSDNNEIIGKRIFKPLGVRNPLMNKYSLNYDVKVKGEKVTRQMTVGTFVKKHKRGTYILTVKGHAFTIKNGTVIGNLTDSYQKKKIVEAAWKITK